MEKNSQPYYFPVDIGDTVYTNCSHVGWYLRKKDMPYKCKVVFIGINGEEDFFHVVYESGNMCRFLFKEIGTRVFLTKEGALKQIEEFNNPG